MNTSNDSDDTMKNFDCSRDDFADRLRMLSPVGCDHLTEMTFYQAGWSAAEKQLMNAGSLQVMVRKGPSDRLQWPWRTFAFGMVSGLLFSVAFIRDWTGDNVLNPFGGGPQLTRNDTVSAPQKKTATRVPEPDTVERTQILPVLRTGLLSSLTDAVLPWTADDRTRQTTSASSIAPELSLAARTQWSEVSASRFSPDLEATSISSTAHPEVSRDQVLRTFPLSDEVVGEFL